MKKEMTLHKSKTKFKNILINLYSYIIQDFIDPISRHCKSMLIQQHNNVLCGFV